MTLLVGHVTRKTVSEMTYNVSSGTLNSTIPYHCFSRDRITILLPYVSIVYLMLIIIFAKQYVNFFQYFGLLYGVYSVIVNAARPVSMVWQCLLMPGFQRLAPTYGKW